ncbi:hypothetical protein DUT90_01930 [Polaribacter sp. WD7]|uniref:hypothetical protein n=1 Tax=Polaribacter sp. WD7 TaxID=2269061 RepID=UPI000DF49FF9|nr:hypothetical protein [Polaribacter sp. WD7]RCS28090.1 hypothetical protein DUT90_01930 [Polaribacter sp. WD7]
MVASDVYNIAKALSKEEFVKLYNMLRTDVNKNNLKIRNKLPEFSKKDALQYLLENHIKKNRTNRTR